MSVLDNNYTLQEIDCGATVHSLRSLVSSDETNSLELNDAIPSKIRRRSLKRNNRHYHCSPSQRSISTEMSIIACSSPEIKALVLPITITVPEKIRNSGASTSTPSSVQYHHQRSVSTLSLFPEDDDGGDECDSFSVAAKIKYKNDNGFPIVANISRNNNNSNDYDRRSVEYRDQDNCHSTNHCDRDDERDTSTQILFNDETDELALYLERQSIGSDTIYSPTALLKTDTRIPSPTTVIPNTANLFSVVQHPIKKGSLQRRRSSMHRRVSYDSLPEISEILFQPDLHSYRTTQFSCE